MQQDQSSRRGGDDARARTPWLEYLAATAGAAFAAGVLSVLAWEAFAVTVTPPDIAVEVVRVQRASGGFAVDIRATNRGSETASDVMVEGVAGEETGETTFDFVPGGSERVGTLVFQADPGPGGPQLRVRGYREP